jgi:hemerythrin
MKNWYLAGGFWTATQPAMTCRSSWHGDWPIFEILGGRMFAWNESFSVGNREIDEQHKRLFTIVADLHTAMKNGQSRAILGEILDRLVDYTVKHFVAEESFMRTHGYAELPQHRLIHDQFTSRIRKFQEEHKSGAVLVNVELMDFLQRWLVNHIQGVDMKYASLLKVGA